MADLKVKSEIAGSVWKIEVAVGDRVAADDPLIILESMKMEIPVLAPKAGVIKEIRVSEGEAIGEGQCLLTTGSDSLDMIALHLARLDIPFTPLEPAELRDRCAELRDRCAVLAERLSQAAHRYPAEEPAHD